MKFLLFRFGWWLVQRYKPQVFGVWAPIPNGSEYEIIHKKPVPGSSDPLDVYETVGIKIIPLSYLWRANIGWRNVSSKTEQEDQ